MTKSVTRRERRANRRTLRAVLRRRCAEARIAASCRRRPRSLATVAIAAGVDRTTAAGLANGLRSVAKRLGVTPVETATTRRTVHGGRASRTHTVAHYSLGQVRALVAAYKPRKSDYIAARALVLDFAA